MRRQNASRGSVDSVESKYKVSRESVFLGVLWGPSKVFWVVLGVFGGCFGVLCWYFGVLLGLYWGTIGVFLRQSYLDSLWIFWTVSKLSGQSLDCTSRQFLHRFSEQSLDCLDSF